MPIAAICRRLFVCSRKRVPKATRECITIQRDELNVLIEHRAEERAVEIIRAAAVSRGIAEPLPKPPRALTPHDIDTFAAALRTADHASNTVRSYVAKARAFASWLGERDAEQAHAVEYKNELKARYKPATVNAYIAAINRFFRHIGHHAQLKPLRIQQPDALPVGSRLDDADVSAMLASAASCDDARAFWIIRTLAETGVRASELRFFNRAAVAARAVTVTNKGKTRTVTLSDDLADGLRKYADCLRFKRSDLPLFVSRTGSSLSTSQLWRILQRQASAAHVSTSKAHAHAFRHFFAARYYAETRDLDALARILGHSSVSTSRIYTRSRDFARTVSPIAIDAA